MTLSKVINERIVTLSEVSTEVEATRAEIEAMAAKLKQLADHCASMLAALDGKREPTVSELLLELMSDGRERSATEMIRVIEKSGFDSNTIGARICVLAKGPKAILQRVGWGRYKLKGFAGLNAPASARL